jgi:hypothetical protein
MNCAPPRPAQSVLGPLGSLAYMTNPRGHRLAAYFWPAYAPGPNSQQPDDVSTRAAPPAPAALDTQTADSSPQPLGSGPQEPGAAAAASGERAGGRDAGPFARAASAALADAPRAASPVPTPGRPLAATARRAGRRVRFAGAADGEGGGGAGEAAAAALRHTASRAALGPMSRTRSLAAANLLTQAISIASQLCVQHEELAEQLARGGGGGGVEEVLARAASLAPTLAEDPAVAAAALEAAAAAAVADAGSGPQAGQEEEEEENEEEDDVFQDATSFGDLQDAAAAQGPVEPAPPADYASGLGSCTACAAALPPPTPAPVDATAGGMARPSLRRMPKGVVVAVHGHGAYLAWDFLRTECPGSPPCHAGSWVEALNRQARAC